MALILKPARPWHYYAITVLAVIFLLSGAYLLYTVLSPFTHSHFINPTNNTTTRLLEQTKEDIADQQVYIPKIDINLPYATGDASVMEHGAWWRAPGNGNPEDGGNFVLSAHRFVMGVTPEHTQRQSPFYNINKLVIGDEIIIDYHHTRYTYVISKIYSVKPDAIEIENRTDTPQLTLYSCTLGGASDGREVVIATPKV